MLRSSAGRCSALAYGETWRSSPSSPQPRRWGLGLLSTHILEHERIVHAPFPVDFVASEAIVGNLGNVAGALAGLGGGDFFGGPVSGGNLFTFAAGALTLLALALVLRALARRPTARAEKTERADAGGEAREIFIAYWGLVLVLTLLAFALTSFSGSAGNARYVIAAWPALAALVAVAATDPRTRPLVIAGAVAFVGLNLRGVLDSGVLPDGVGPSQQAAGAAERFAVANRATVGYTGYWDAAPITWETRLRLQVRPIEPCPTGICPYPTASISSWYRPRRAIRTFLITDARVNVPERIETPPAAFGVPVASTLLPEGLAIYVYDHDIASDLS